MADILNGMPIPVYAIDRMVFATRAAMTKTIKFHIASGSIVQVEDSAHPRTERFCYEIRPVGSGLQLVDAAGRQLGIFADVAAMVDHAETVTA